MLQDRVYSHLVTQACGRGLIADLLQFIWSSQRFLFWHLNSLKTFVHPGFWSLRYLNAKKCWLLQINCSRLAIIYHYLGCTRLSLGLAEVKSLDNNLSWSHRISKAYTHLNLPSGLSNISNSKVTTSGNKMSLLATTPRSRWGVAQWPSKSQSLVPATGRTAGNAKDLSLQTAVGQSKQDWPRQANSRTQHTAVSCSSMQHLTRQFNKSIQALRQKKIRQCLLHNLPVCTKCKQNHLLSGCFSFGVIERTKSCGVIKTSDSPCSLMTFKVAKYRKILSGVE